MRGESDMDCAIREFCEETNYNKLDIKIFSNVKPLIENTIGTNGVNYRHIYYLAEDISQNVPIIDDRNSSEIGDIGFFTYEETLQIFRKYHIEKKTIAKNAFLYCLDTLINKSKYNKSNDTLMWSTDEDIF
jgi:8-oxo-dGTP pyrophosphatase MutT (NUDIX family)